MAPAKSPQPTQHPKPPKPKSAKATKAERPRPVAQNRKARHDYDILETIECGLALVGSEVKSMRASRVQLRDSYARIDGGEVWLHGVHIAPYAFAHGRDGHDPERARKLLLHRREIDRLAMRTQQDGLTLVPLTIYFKEGRAKLELALARGRKHYDKRRAIAERDFQRDSARSLARSGRDD